MLNPEMREIATRRAQTEPANRGADNVGMLARAALAGPSTWTSESSPAPYIDELPPGSLPPSYNPTAKIDRSDSAQARADWYAFGHWAADNREPPLGTEHVETVPGSLQQTTARTPGLGAPTRFDLGDRAVGTRNDKDLFVANIEADDAIARVTYEGAPEITLMSAPERLRPAHDGLDPTTAIRLRFLPTAKGHYQGTITVFASWRSRPATTLQIAVEAAAHEIGQPDLAVEEAAVRERDANQQHEAASRRETESANAAAAFRLEHDQAIGSPLRREGLRDAAEAAAGALGHLFETRRLGVRDARDEAALYEHREPEYHPSLVEQLAFAALDVVTAGFASAIGKRLEAVLADKVVTAAHTEWWDGRAVPETTYTPSKAIAAIFSGAARDIVRQAAKAASPEPRSGKPQASDPGPSSVARIEFFSLEEHGLNNQNDSKANAVTNDARNALEPLLATHPMQAIASMRAIAAELDALATAHEIAHLQRDQSAFHWIRYVAQTSVGDVDANQAQVRGQLTREHGGATTDITRANMAPNGDGKITSYDGLVDIEFTADRTHPERPVTVIKARVDGVSQAIANHLAKGRLLDAGVAVRAHGLAEGAGLEVIRDEAGNVEYADDTGVPGMPTARWFATKAGEPNGGPDAEIRGARKLIEQEIMAQPLPAAVETDSVDKR